jgi:hypothetical protein
MLYVRAGEYVGKEWQSIWRHNFVKYQYTNAGVHMAQRIWQTLQDSMRATMCTAQYMKMQSTVAFQHAVWLYKRMPRKHHGTKLSPFEFVKPLKPDLKQVRIFDAKCLKFQFKERNVDKLANRSEQCLYVGHSEERVSTFLFYLTEEGKVTEGGISKFDENIDEYGKLLSTFDSTHTQNFEAKSRRHEPYLAVEQYDLKIKAIFDADVYYDVTDNETYLVRRIMTLNNKPQTGRT